MSLPSEEFKAWHTKRAAIILKRAEELAAEYIKEGFSDSGPTRCTALYKAVEDADVSGWDAWQAGREAVLEEAAQVCDERANGENDAQWCADRIRSLK